MINRYAPPAARLDFAQQRSMRPFALVAAACVMEFITFAVTWIMGFPLTDSVATAFWIGTLSAWIVLVTLAWLASRQHKVARTVLLWLLVLMSLNLALGSVGAFFIALPRAPPRLLWRVYFGAGVHLLQFALSVVAIWLLRRERLTAHETIQAGAPE